MIIKNLRLQSKYNEKEREEKKQKVEEEIFIPSRANFEQSVVSGSESEEAIQDIENMQDIEEGPINKEPSTKRFTHWKFWLGSLFWVLCIALVSYFILVYKQEDISPQKHVTQIAGDSIIKTTQLVNPSKQEKRYVSALIMGIDTRGIEFNGNEYVATKRGGTRKIDVIMQIVYDRQTHKVTFISIPRDTSLPATEECMHQEREDQKYINRFYDMAEKNNCPFSGVDAMKKYVSYITGFGIDYYAIITLDSFVELINIVGEEQNGKKGMWVDVPRNIGDYCPNNYNGYDYVYFKQGRQFLTSKQVLCFVRVRKTSNDFDRNRRQQELMTEIGDRIISSDTLSDPYKLFEIYNSFRGKVQMSDISIKDVSLGVEMLSEVDMSSVQKIVLDHEFGGTNALLTKPLYSPPGTHTRSGYYLIPTMWDQSCCQEDEWKLVRDFMHKLMEDPNTKIEQAAIFAYVHKYTGGKAVFNNDQYQAFKTKAQEEYVFYHESKYAEPIITSGSDIQIFDFTKGKKKHIADKIAALSGGQVYDGSQAPFKPLNHEEIAIVVRVK